MGEKEEIDRNLIPSKIDADYLKKFIRRNMSLQKFIVMKTFI